MNALAPMLLTSRTGEPLVLEGVSASGQLHDALLTMTIEQRYRNPGTKHAEAIYTFPLPWGAVLMAVEVDLGGKSLSGQVHARPQAEAKYEKTLSEGDAAILLERNRDGSHTLNLGNLAPGEQCSIRIRYAQPMSVEQGCVRLMLPTVIAPRYGDPADAGLQPQQVPEVDLMAAYPLEVTVDIFGSLAAARVASPSHPISVGPHYASGAAGVRVSLSRQSWLDRDVVLLLGPVRHESLGQALADPFTPGQTAVKLAFKPRVPARDTPILLKILVDCSSSMLGDNLASAREALNSIIGQLEENERFSLSRFGSTFEHRSRALWAVTPATLQAAQRWVAQLEADLGGTQMEAALASTFELGVGTATDAASGAPAQADVLLVTDGQITAVADTVALARASGHRVFVVGIGSAANDQLIHQLAEATGGACEFVAPGEAVAPAVMRMFHRLRGGQVRGLQLEWPSGITPVWQQALPKSVFDGDTVHIHALLDTPVNGALALFVCLQPESAPTVLAELTLLPSAQASDTEASTLARMVAWAQIKEWAPATTAQAPPSAKAEARQRIAELAITYQLVTEESCFVLVHERAAADKALDMPEQIRIKQMLAAGWAGSSSIDAPVNHSIRFSRTKSADTVMSSASMPSTVWRINRGPAASYHGEDDAFFGAPLEMSQITPRRSTAAKPLSWLRQLGQSMQRKAQPRASLAHDLGHSLDDLDGLDEVKSDLSGRVQPSQSQHQDIDRTDARLWATGIAYTGLTPLGLVQWLDKKSMAEWPTDLDGLAAAGVGQAVIDWIEFVLTEHWRLIADHLSPVTILLCWLDGTTVRTFLADTLSPHAEPVPPSGDLALVLAGITARAWPAQVFALENPTAPNPSMKGYSGIISQRPLSNKWHTIL